MLSKILVPVDGSENSFRALEQAIFLATKIQEAKITALYVIEDPPSLYIYSPKIIEKLHADYKSEYTKILERCKEMASNSGININTVLLEGDPASKIIGYSEMEKFIRNKYERKIFMDNPNKVNDSRYVIIYIFFQIYY